MAGLSRCLVGALLVVTGRVVPPSNTRPHDQLFRPSQPSAKPCYCVYHSYWTLNQAPVAVAIAPIPAKLAADAGAALRSAQKDQHLIMGTSLPWPLPHISLVSDSHFDALRMEPKRKASASRLKQKMGHSERQYELVSAACPDRKYRLFVRQSIANQDVFSVGLTLIQSDGDLVLCRYNSGHHGHRNILEKTKLPPACHQHIMTHRYIAAGLESKGFAVLRTEYNSVEGALTLMVHECNILNVLQHDPQAKLFPP